MPEFPIVPWLALIIGNTRLHWAVFTHDDLQGTWHSRHLQPAEVARLIDQQFTASAWADLTTDSVPSHLTDWRNSRLPATDEIALYVASVVPSQFALWQPYPGMQAVSLTQMPLQNLYPTLGIDRALTLLGASHRYGWPVLAIDAGTALTLTAGDAGALLGGAILPGLEMQLQALSQETADLPQVTMSVQLPDRWAKTTEAAIKSGVAYGLIATMRDFLADWHRRYPGAPATLTGGDGVRFLQWLPLGDRWPNLHYEPDLVFWGMACYRQHLITTTIH